MKSITKKLDVQKLREEHKEVIDSIGTCPLSQSDTIEAMQGGDCMCLCLQISRSEATIQDPSKLIIHDIVHTYMTCDSFLESSIFNLRKNEEASGGFDY